jgi:hypothetical protein
VFGKDSAASWRYIDARQKMLVGGKPTSKRTIKRELEVLRLAISIAKSRGRWSGDLDMILPEEFTAPPSPKGDSISREQALRLFPHMPEDTAAAMAFSLATGAEMSALRHAVRSDIPTDLATCERILVRGTKNDHRTAIVPVVTDEQKVLLDYARRHGQGQGGHLFGKLSNMCRDLKEACQAEQVVVISPHDLRRSSGQWMIDLGVPIELVSKFMRHKTTTMTETAYASVKQEDVGRRILAVLDPAHARQAHETVEKKVVETIKAVPAPRSPVLYEHDGQARTLTQWAKVSGLSKTTLHYRLVTCGMPVAEAVKGGRLAPRGVDPRRKAAA